MPKKPRDWRQMWVTVPPAMEAAIRREADLNAVSMSEVVRACVEKQLMRPVER